MTTLYWQQATTSLECYPMAPFDRRCVGLLLSAPPLTACAAPRPITTFPDARAGSVAFASTTPTLQQFLTGGRTNEQAVVAAELRLPSGPAERFPAVVLVHGSGGVEEYHYRWAADLTSIGIAVFIIDSFGWRGLATVKDDQSRLNPASRTRIAPSSCWRRIPASIATASPSWGSPTGASWRSMRRSRASSAS